MLKKQGTFFATGWLMVAVTFFVLMVTQGFGLYSFSMLKVPMTATLKAAETQVALGFSCYTIATAVGSLFVGDLIERIGLRKTLILAAIVFSGGFSLLTFISEGTLTLFYIAYFIMGMGSALCGAVVISGIPANWFVRQRGIATAVVWCAMLPGSFVATNTVAALSTTLGWQYAVYALAGISFVVVLLAALILRWRPQELGLLPDGAATAAAADDKANGVSTTTDQTVGLTRRQALKTTTFWLLLIAFGLCGICEMGPFQNMPTYLIAQGNDLAFSASFMTFLAFAGIVGKLSAGLIIDRFKPRFAFTFVNALCFIGLGMFFFGARDGLLLYVAGFFFGYALSAAMICFSTATALYLGVRHYGQIWGLIYLMKPLSDAVGVPLFAGIGAFSWQGAFLVAIVCLVVCTAGFAGAREIKAVRKRKESPAISPDCG
ncbi:MAG: MFS transporter [Coriobacteriales bacterium]|jgi:MFS family permease|nr:MFS transporter [Coriobacteriales bacterium]